MDDPVLWILNSNLYKVIMGKVFKAMPIPVYSQTYWIDVLDAYQKAGGKFLEPSYDDSVVCLTNADS